MLYTIASDKMIYTFSDVGGELISAKSTEGFEYMWRADAAIWGKHAPILFPFCGKLLGDRYTFGGKEYGYRSHGFVSKSNLELLEVTENSVSFTMSESDETKKIYPFDFKFTVKYVAEGNSLSAHFTVENRSGETMLYMLGGHPGFSTEINEGAIHSDYTVDLGTEEPRLHKLLHPSCVCAEAEPYHVTGGALTLDNARFLPDETATLILSGVAGKVRLSTKKGPRAVELEYTEGFGYLCIWKLTQEGAEYVCLEPWTGVPSDASEPVALEERRTMLSLPTGQTHEHAYTITFI